MLLIQLKKNGFLNGKQQILKTKNVDLWLDFLKLFDKNTIKFNWIKGHNNHPQNEKCDKLAFDASKSKNSSLDLEYEKTNKPL